VDPEPRDEESLWRDRASEGDPIALGHIYDAYAQRIYRYLYRRSGDAALAEDLTADVFLRLVEACRTPSFCQGALAPWLYRLAHNRLVDFYRRRRETPLPDDYDQPSNDDAAAGAHRRELRAAIRQLTPDQQQVVALKFLEGLTNTQIAAAISKPEGAVKSLQHRALDSLRRLLGADR
jgi:RNA polymerase sigma-70 factor, ECF subfamily